MTLPTCNGITKGGERCRARPLLGTNYCLAHSPTVTEQQRAAWRAKGGANSSARARAKKALPAEVMTIEEVAAWLGVVYKGVIAKKIDPSVATAAANVARTLNELAKTTEIDERFVALDELFADARRPA